MPCFCFLTDDVILESRSSLSFAYKTIIIMDFNINFSFCVRERLCKDCKKVQRRKRIRVRGHFRVVNGKKVYVKTHFRKK